jgi:hypothetical protein
MSNTEKNTYELAERERVGGAMDNLLEAEDFLLLQLLQLEVCIGSRESRYTDCSKNT